MAIINFNSFIHISSKTRYENNENLCIMKHIPNISEIRYGTLNLNRYPKR